MNSAIVDSNVVCSYEYFQAVLRLLISEEIAWAHVTILEGFVTSAGSGSQSVLEAARHALINFVETVTAEPGLHSFTLIKLWKTLTKMLQSHQKDDRVTIPTLEVLAFLFDSRIETLTDNDNFESVCPINQTQNITLTTTVGYPCSSSCRQSTSDPETYPSSKHPSRFTLG